MLTERKLRQIIRKMIMEVTGQDAARFMNLASSTREQPGSKQEEFFASGLGSSDKDIADNIQKLQDLIMGGVPIDPLKKEQVSTLIQKAIAVLR
jgi:hypothetical protein